MSNAVNGLSVLNGLYTKLLGTVGKLIGKIMASKGAIAALAGNVGTALAAYGAPLLIVGGSIAAGILKDKSDKKNKKQKREKIKTNAKEATESINNSKKSIEKLEKDANKLIDRYAELAQGVNQLTNENIKLSTEEYEEFLNIGTELATLFPDLSATYDENGKAMLGLSGDVNTITSSLEKLLETEKKLANEEILKNLPSVLEEAKTATEEHKKALDYLNTDLVNQQNMLQQVREVERELQNGYIKVSAQDENMFNMLAGNYVQAVQGVTHQYKVEPVTFENGMYSQKIQITTDSEAVKEEIQKAISEIQPEAELEANVKITTKNISDLEAHFADTWQPFADGLIKSFETDSSSIYNSMDENMQNFIDSAISNLSYKDLEIENVEEGKKFVEDNILKLFSSYDTQSYITDLFKLDFSNMSPEEIKSSIMEYIDQIVKVAEELEIEGVDSNYFLKVFGLDEYVTVADNFATIKDQIARTVVGVEEGKEMHEGQRQHYNNMAYQIDQFAKEYSINTQDEIAAFNDAWGKANGNLDKAFELYLRHLEEKNKKKSFEEVFNAEGFKESKEELLELAKAGELTPETLKSVEDYNKLLDETGLTIKDVCKEINNLIDATARLSDMSSDLSSLGTAYKEFKEDGYASVDSIESLRKKFGELKGSDGKKLFEDFAIIVGSDKTSVEDKQDAFNKLASSYLLQEQALGKLTDANKDYYITQLKSMGIANAETLVTNRLKAETEALALKEEVLAATADGVNETSAENIKKLLDQAGATQLCRSALFQLHIQEVIFNSSQLDPRGKIEALIELAKAYGVTTKSLEDAQNAIKAYELSGGHSGLNFTETDVRRIQESLYAEFAEKVEFDEPDGSGSKNSETTFDWIEVRIAKLSKELEKLKETAQDSFSGWTERSDAYDTASAKIKGLIEEQKKAKKEYEAEAKKIGLTEKNDKGIAYTKLIQEGAIDLNTIDNENLIKKIQEYQDLYNKAQGCQDAIDQLNKDFEEMYRDSRAFRWETFDYLMDSISRATEEAEYFIDLLSGEDLFDDNGNMTKYADATLGLHYSNIDTYKQMAKDYLEEIDSIEKEISKKGASQELIDRKNELTDAHRDAINAVKDEQEAILDLVDQGYQKQLDALQKLIDKKKESLNIEKDLFDYQKNIEAQSKKVSSLQRQYDIYKNDTSEEGKAQAQKLKVELEAAQEELEQTQYEKYLADQESMLDKLASDYEEWMNNRLNREEELLEEIRNNTAQKDIFSTIEELANENGTEVSTELKSSIIEGTTTAINSIAKAIVEALGGDSSHIGNIGGYASGTKRSGKEWAWTQEEGVELIRTKDGALLTPLDNSMVFNNESSRRLWEFSQNPVEYLSKLGIQDIAPQINMISPKLPDIARNVSSNPVINLGGINIVCNEVSNADEIVNDLISNKKFEKAMFSAVGNAMTGGNSLSKFRY